MGLTLVTAAATEPVTRAEAKLYLRLTATDEDATVDSLIASARSYAETVLRRQLVTATYDWKLDSFSDVLYPPLPPLQSVTSISYVDTAGASQTFSSSKYSVDVSTEPGRIVLAYGETWPSIRDQANAVTVRFVTGYGAASAVPDAAKTAIKMLVAHYFEHREAVVVGTIVAEIPKAVDALLAGLRWGSYA